MMSLVLSASDYGIKASGRVVNQQKWNTLQAGGSPSKPPLCRSCTLAWNVQSQILLLLETQGRYKYWAGWSDTLGSRTVLNQVQTSRFVSGDISNLSEVSALCSTQVLTSITTSS